VNVIDFKFYKFDTVEMSINHLSPQYVAGFFDGEGCISVFFTPYKYKVTTIPVAAKGAYRMVISISNTHRGILEQLQAQFGGAIHVHNKNIAANHSAAVAWHLHNAELQRKFLVEILPYAVIKKPHIENALRYLATVKHPNYRPTTEEWRLRRACWVVSESLNVRGLKGSIRTVREL
jgi:hypothetical protein